MERDKLMERSKLIEILENGSEAELILIQNYILDQILKKMPTEKEAIQRCVESTGKIKELEAEIARLNLMIISLQRDLDSVRGSKYYTTSWDSVTTSVSGFSSSSITTGSYSNNCDSVTYTTSTTVI
jgi:histidyl-tRNA synthetase